MSSDPAQLAIVVKCWPRLSETFVAQELAALEQRGVRFVIWSLRYPANEKKHPLHEAVSADIYYLPEYLHKEPLRVLRAWWKIRRNPRYAISKAQWWKDLKRDLTRNRIRRFGQSLVMAADLTPGTLAMYAHFLHTPASVARYAAIIHGMPWGFSAHAKDIWTSPDWEISEKLDPSNHGARFGVTCTASGLQQLQRFTDSPSMIELVYHGLDLNRFPAPPERNTSQSTNSSSDARKIRFLSVGRLVEKKGFDRLIEALAKLPATLNWQWTHIGGGALNDQMQSLATELNVANKIEWLGECEQPQVIEAMRESDVFVLPSRVARDGDRDGLPNVLMEAASQKLSIIATPVSAIPEFIEHDVHGLLVDDDPAILAQALLQLASNAEKRSALAEAAYQRLTAEFGVDAGLNTLQGHLQEMLQQNPA